MPWRRLGLAILEEDAKRLDRLVEKYGLTRNALLRFAIAYFLKHIDTGEVELEKYLKTETKLTRPNGD